MSKKYTKLLDSIRVSVESEGKDRLSDRWSTTEMEEANKDMRISSFPGMEAVPAALYQLQPIMFVECMKIEIVLEYQLIEGVLPRAQRHSTIPFLYK